MKSPKPETSKTKLNPSAPTHTPGPWTDQSIDESQWGIYTVDHAVCIGQASQVRPIIQDIKQVERTANARLMAAAPELLEALRYARRFLKKEDHDVDYIDAIITKATEEPTND